MANISYTPTVWADGSGGGTPIDSTKLNNIENGIVDAVAAIGPNDTTQDGTLKAQINALSTSMSKIVSYSDSGSMLVRYEFDSNNFIQLGYNVSEQRFYVGLKVNGVDKGQKNIVTGW